MTLNFLALNRDKLNGVQCCRKRNIFEKSKQKVTQTAKFWIM